MRVASLSTMTSIVMLFVALGCTTKKPQSDLAGVGDGGVNAIGLIPVRNLPGFDVGGAADENNLGNRYAADLLDMRLLAVVQCGTTSMLSADQWMIKLESMALLNQVFINSDRTIVTTNSRTGKATDPVPCVAMGSRLLSYPVAAKILNLVRAGAVLSKETMAAAQFFYLSLKGYEDRKNPESVPPLLMVYAQMAREHLGPTGPTANEVMADMEKIDSDLNPCSSRRGTTKLSKEAIAWRDQNFKCEPVEGQDGVYSFVPNDSKYALLRDQTLNRIDDLHTTLYGTDADQKVATAHKQLWMLITSTRDFSSVKSSSPLFGVASLLAGKSTNRFKSLFASDSYGDQTLGFDDFEIVGKDTGAGLNLAETAAPKKKITQAEAAARVGMPLADFKKLPAAEQQARFKAAVAKGTTPKTPGAGDKTVDSNASKPMTALPAASKAALAKQYSDEATLLETAKAAVRNNGAGKPVAENPSVQDLNALYAIAKSEGADTSKIEATAGKLGLKIQDGWKVEGLVGGKAANEYVRVTGPNGEMHFRNAASGATQNWMKTSDKFEASTLGAIGAAKVSDSKVAKTAGNTDVMFESSKTVLKKDGEVVAGAWRADTTDGKKGVVDTTLGVNFFNGQKSIPVPEKTVLQDGLVHAAKGNEPGGKENHDRMLTSLHEANAKLREDNKANCDAIAAADKKLAELDQKITDNNKKMPDGAAPTPENIKLGEELAAARKEIDTQKATITADREKAVAAREANITNQNTNTKVAEESGQFDSETGKKELAAERAATAASCGGGASKLAFALDGDCPTAGAETAGGKTTDDGTLTAEKTAADPTKSDPVKLDEPKTAESIAAEAGVKENTAAAAAAATGDLSEAEKAAVTVAETGKFDDKTGQPIDNTGAIVTAADKTAIEQSPAVTTETTPFKDVATNLPGEVTAEPAPQGSKELATDALAAGAASEAAERATDASLDTSLMTTGTVDAFPPFETLPAGTGIGTPGLEQTTGIDQSGFVDQTIDQSGYVDQSGYSDNSFTAQPTAQNVGLGDGFTTPASQPTFSDDGFSTLGGQESPTFVAQDPVTVPEQSFQSYDLPPNPAPMDSFAGEPSTPAAEPTFSAPEPTFSEPASTGMEGMALKGAQ